MRNIESKFMSSILRYNWGLELIIKRLGHILNKIYSQLIIIDKLGITIKKLRKIMTEDQITIICDTREPKSIMKAMKFIQKQENLNINIRTEMLEFGDYIISTRMAFERKRGDDLVSSVFDNRFFQQLSKLKNYFQFPIILLENPQKIFSRPTVLEGPIYGALAYATYKMGVSLIPTNTEKETAQLLIDLAREEKEHGFELDSNFSIDQNRIENEPISPEDQIYFLEGLVRTGRKSAKKLLNYFQTPKYILYALEQTHIHFNPKGEPYKIEGMLENIKGFGPKYIEWNKKIYTSSAKEAKATKKKTFTH